MRKTLKLLAAVAASGAAMGSVLGAASAAPGAALSDTIAASDVSAMLAEFEITSELRSSQAGGPSSLVATTSGGAKFLIGFFDCVDQARSAGCKQVMVSTAQSSGGVAFEELNAFNGQSSVTTVVYEPQSQILIFGRNIFMPGGIGRDNFKLQVALFLNDMQKFVEGRRGSAKSVSFSERPSLKSKISAMATEDKTAQQAALAQTHDLDAVIEIAIDNSLDVNYSAGLSQ